LIIAVLIVGACVVFGMSFIGLFMGAWQKGKIIAHRNRKKWERWEKEYKEDKGL